MGTTLLDSLANGVQAFHQSDIVPTSFVDLCWLFGNCGGGGGGGGNAVPEIDGPAGIAALALVVSVGMVIYNRARS